MIILVPSFYIAINEKYVIEDKVIEQSPNEISWSGESPSEPDVEDTTSIESITEGILAEWNVNIWSDLEKLFN